MRHRRSEVYPIGLALMLAIAVHALAQDQPDRVRSTHVDTQSMAPQNDFPAATLEGESLRSRGRLLAEVIPAAAFTHDGFEPSSSRFLANTGRIVGSDQTYGCLVAPVYLPGDVEVVALWVSAIDEDSTFDVSMTLRKISSVSVSSVAMVTATTVGTPGLATAANPDVEDPMVMRETQSLYLTTCVPSRDLELLSARILYIPLSP